MKKIQENELYYGVFILIAYNVGLSYATEFLNIPQIKIFFLIINTLIMFIMLTYFYKYDKKVYDVLDELEKTLDKNGKK